MMIARTTYALLALAALSLTGCAGHSPLAAGDGKDETASVCQTPTLKAERMAVTVNGCGIAKSVLPAEVNGQVVSAEMTQKMLDELIGRELIRQEFAGPNTPKDSDFQEKLDHALRMASSQVASDHYMKTLSISDAELRKAYEQKKTEAGPMLIYKVGHILLASEEEANEVIAKLKKGESFEKLAKKLSKDTGSKERGGDLDWLRPNGSVPEFDQALAGMKDGEISQAPVQTKFGWHVIRREASKEQAFPSFEEIRDRLDAFVRMEKFQQHIEALKAKAKVVKHDASK